MIQEKEEVVRQITSSPDSDLLIILPKDSPHMGLIEKILAAIKINDITQCNILSLQSEVPLALMPCISDFGIQRMLSFGYTPNHLGINIDTTFYHIYQLHQTEMLFTADMDTLAADAQHKKLLWSALQNWIPTS